MIKFILLILLFLVGCKPSDNPIFNLPKNLEPEQSTQGLDIKIRQESSPNDTDTTFILAEEDLPDDSLYFSISQNSFNSSSFQLNVKVKQIIGMYDVPITIEYDPSILEFQFNTTSNSLIEGPIESRLRKFLPRNLITLLSSPNPQKSGQIVISHSLLVDLGLNQSYSGTLFSVPFRIIAPGNLKTSIGFIPSSSDILNRDGDSINVQFYGGTIIRSLDS